MIALPRIPAVTRDRRFVALWAAHSISTLGDALTTLTLILLITEKTHSVAAVGVLTIVIAVPGIALGLVAGAYVDRNDRRRTMIVADLGRGLLLAALAVLVVGSFSLFALCAIAFLQACVGTLFTPARAALMQVVVPADAQVRANSLIQMTTVVGELTGTAAAGLLVAAWHTYWIAFLVDAATFLASAVLIMTIRRLAVRTLAHPQRTLPAILDGVRAVRSSPTLRALLLVFGALTFALAPMAVLLTPYIVDDLRIPTGWIGLIQAGDTAGTVVGGIAISMIARRVAPRGLVIAGMGALAALLASLALATSVATLLVTYTVFGLLTVSVQSGIGALTATEVDNALMGRFVGLMSVVPGTVSVLAMAFAGVLGAVVGIPTIFVISGAVLAAATSVAWYQFRSTAHRRDADTAA